MFGLFHVSASVTTRVIGAFFLFRLPKVRPATFGKLKANGEQTKVIYECSRRFELRCWLAGKLD